MVYLVVEEYDFDGYETNISVFRTLADARKYQEQIIKREETTSWIRDMVDCDDLNMVDGNHIIDHDNPDYYVAHDYIQGYASYIYILAKEVQ